MSPAEKKLAELSSALVLLAVLIFGGPFIGFILNFKRDFFFKSMKPFFFQFISEVVKESRNR